MIARAHPARKRHVPGEEGTWVFIFGDMSVFALLFGVYLYYRGQDPQLYDASQLHLDLNLGATNTLLLLTSSLLVVVGMRRIRNGSQAAAQRFFAGAIVCGLGFVAIKAIEYTDKLSAGYEPSTNDFWMYYYILTGLHLFHLLLGLAVLVYLLVQARRAAIDERRFMFVEGGACFWHMVDLLWIVLFPLLYLVR